jgi:hypothetical protein
VTVRDTSLFHQPSVNIPPIFQSHNLTMLF